MTVETVRSLAALVGGNVVGDPGLEIDGVGDIRFAGPRQLGFLRSERLVAMAETSSAGAVLVPSRLELPMTQIVVADPSTAFARIAARFHPRPTATEHAVHPTAVVAADARLEPPVRIGPHVTVGAGARIGAGTILEPGVHIGAQVRIGRDCLLHPRVVVYDGATIGNRVIVHAGTVLGADGFGYARGDDEWIKVPQIGNVVIEDDVELGANVTIDRGTIGTTRVGRGTKIDNLVHLGHNCEIGARCAIAGLSAFSGSTAVGNDVVIGGHTVVAGHLKVAAGVRIGGNSVLLSDVTEPGDYMGYPLQKRMRWGRTLWVLRHLVDMRGLLRHLDRIDRRNEAERTARGMPATERKSE
ncbi:MAG: UDP-3-O-(3-hydroxymyristoyl)glucosamine N-acyltransferase [Planctomycetes bacterium]|nr:UDP-3-O-(3-hydroxymyristoyl)glucosamine N-acyltransferase [Planctomycetota bacterium]